MCALCLYTARLFASKMPTRVRLFRRNNRQSFSVQLAHCSGVVEVHCTRVSVLGLDGSRLDRLLEERLARLGREEFGCLGGFGEGPAEGGWDVQLLELGPFSLASRGFVGCILQFAPTAEDDAVVAQQVSATRSSSDAHAKHEKKRALKWCQSVR